MNNIHKILILICILGGVLRLWQLGVVPTGLSNDEAGYIYSSYSIWKTGHDVAGKFLPLSINLNASFSPVYIYVDAPFVGLLGLSPFSGRLPYALVSIACIPLLYLLSKELTRNQYISLLSAFLLAVSPWHLQLSRAAMDADFALFFFLAGIYVFIKYITKHGILYSLPLFLLGFYSYHATKIFFIFLVPVLLYSYRTILFQRKRETGLFFIGSILIVFSFILVSSSQHVTRQEVMFWSDKITPAKVVNKEREYNTAPQVLKVIFSNKVLYNLKMFRENYLQAFSPDYLFLFGEPSGLKVQYSMQTSGELFIIELPFLLAGLYFFIKQQKSKLLLALLLIAPLPSTFSFDRSYINRSIMLLPMLEILVAYGIYAVYQQLRAHKVYLRMILIGCICFFLFLFSEYLYTYYFRYPVSFGAEGWLQSSKELAQYVGKHHQEYDEVYIDGAEQVFLLQYGIFNIVDPSKTKQAWADFTTNNARIDNIHFISQCHTFNKNKHIVDEFKQKNILVITSGNCYPNDTPAYKIVNRGEVLHVIWKMYELNK